MLRWNSATPSPYRLQGRLGWAAARLLADLLAPHFTTYAIDRRGRGASEHSIQREAADIAAFAADLTD